MGGGKGDISCIEAEELLDYYPLPEYKICNLSVISMHHAIICIIRSNMEAKDSVRQVLPALSEDLLEAVTTKLSDSCVESIEDLQFMEERDLVELLKPIQCRKFLHAWRVKGM